MDDRLSWARAVLATTPGRWQVRVESVSTGLLARPPAPGAWSALQCLHHLLETDRPVFPVRVQAFLRGQDRAAFDPEAQRRDASGQSATDSAAELSRLRLDSLAVVARLSAADLARGARHEERGPVTLGEMLNEWAAHDLTHAVQAGWSLMQPFIAACGAWRPSCSDHNVATRGA